MNTISLVQNSTENIQLLKAQRASYLLSKRCNLVESSLVIIATIVPFLIMIFPRTYNQVTIIIVSSTILLTTIFIENLQKKNTKRGANIQQQFDLGLFNLPWNDTSYGEKVPIEEIIMLAKKKNIGPFNNWYPPEISENIPYEVAVLLCQRTNLFWDVNLRKTYSLLLSISVIVYYVSFTIVGWLTEKSFEQIIILFLPTLVYIKTVFQSIRRQNEITLEKEKLFSLISNFLSKIKSKNLLPTQFDLTSIQDRIFHLRIIDNKAPNWLYKCLRNKYEKISRESITQIINDLNLNLKK